MSIAVHGRQTRAYLDEVMVRSDSVHRGEGRRAISERDDVEEPSSRSDAWRKLLSTALRVVDSLVAAGYGVLPFRLGGGTVLALHFDHRVSEDIDVFIDDAQALGFLTPRLNETAARLTGDYEELANSLKLVFPDGDVDFILAGPVTREAVAQSLDVDGRSVPLEPVAEILAKKILYRAASFKPRDVFDLAVGLVCDPPAVQIALASTRPVHALLLRRLENLKNLDVATLTTDLELTLFGQTHVEGMVERVADAIERFA